MQRLLKEMMAHSHAWAFLHPVDTTELLDYHDVIKHPMGKLLFPLFCQDTALMYSYFPQSDFSTIQDKIKSNKYKTFDSFVDDVQLVFDNCRLYNAENTIWAKNARSMDQFFKKLLEQYLKKEDQ